MSRTTSSLALALLALAACDSSPKAAPAPATTSQATALSPAASAAPAAAAASGLIAWTAPDSWKTVQHPSKMRMATYSIARAEGDPEDAELSVTHVGGGIEANIERWRQQFEGNPEAKIDKRDVRGMQVTVVELKGTYGAGGGPMMGGGTSEPKKDWALLAAIVATQPAAHFFKMTGPAKTVAAARADFDKLVASIAPKS